MQRNHSRLHQWCLGEENPVGVIEVFVDELDLDELGFYAGSCDPKHTIV
jgi:hypothetical protein